MTDDLIERIDFDEQADELVSLLRELKERGYIISYGFFILTPTISATYKDTKINIMTSNEVMSKLINRVSEVDQSNVGLL